MNIQEWVTPFDTSTINDMPDTVTHMVNAESIHMWAYPEPEYGSWEDGSMMTLGEWYIVSSVNGTFRSFGPDIFMGGDQYHYIDTDENE